MSRLLWLLLLLPLSALGTGFENVAHLAGKGFSISAQARLLDSNETLASLDAERLLSPASVSKLYISAAALDRWGPQHRFTTRFLTTGHIDTQGVLQGDLVFEGGGDPALVSEDLWRLVQGLRQQGISGIEGRLVISQWRYGPVQCITTDRCQARNRTANAYSALLSSAAINYGSWCMSVMPGSHVGAAAKVTNCDSEVPITRVNNGVTTAAASGATGLSAERITDPQGDILRIRGKVALGAPPQLIYRASSDPAIQTGETLLAILKQAGINVSGGYATSDTAPLSSSRQLASIEGKPLQELLLRTLNYSNNFMADTLSLNLASQPHAGMAEGAAEIEHFAEALPGHGPLVMKSGSGLTPENRVSAQGVNALLAAMYQRPALFPTFVAGMQLPVNGPMRFVRRGSDIFQNHVMLKTGTLNQPVSVRAIAGYFRTATGRWGSFSVLVNGTAKTPYLTWSQVLEPVSRDLTAMIETH
ncbi:D-alanyl-D-alanine carboxypeptidase/D-alanyl-D-alanine endopeptidase [Halomonas sp. WWR20]